MGNLHTEQPLIVIAGPTASGKTALAIKLAVQYNGEIICADSRTVYKHLDVGTAKPTAAEQKLVPHWGIDLVEPNTRFTAADFKQYAVDTIRDIRKRGKIPFLVGGTGLYIDAVLYDYDFPNTSPLPNHMQNWTIGELQNYCIKNNITLPQNSNNRRYVVNAIERNNAPLKRKHQPIENSIIVGITTDKDSLRQRIAGRTEQIVTKSTFNEAADVALKYGWNNNALTGNIYQLIHMYNNGDISQDELKHKNNTLDWRLAKRQFTWLKRNEHITWLNLDEAYTYIAQRLDSLNNSW